jgi:hypothetical protein
VRPSRVAEALQRPPALSALRSSAPAQTSARVFSTGLHPSIIRQRPDRSSTSGLPAVPGDRFPVLLPICASVQPAPLTCRASDDEQQTSCSLAPKWVSASPLSPLPVWPLRLPDLRHEAAVCSRFLSSAFHSHFKALILCLLLSDDCAVHLATAHPRCVVAVALLVRLNWEAGKYFGLPQDT